MTHYCHSLIVFFLFISVVLNDMLFGYLKLNCAQILVFDVWPGDDGVLLLSLGCLHLFPVPDRNSRAIVLKSALFVDIQSPAYGTFIVHLIRN